MIQELKARQIARLLAEGKSQRQIAKLTGVSRGLVHNIASGKRGLYGWPEGPRPKRKSETEKLLEQEEENLRHPFVIKKGKTML